MVARNIRTVSTYEEQLTLWVDGESVHKATGRKPPNDYECCPDFSCCTPELVRPESERKAFQAASEEERNCMLTMYLGAMLKKMAPGKNIKIVG